MTLKVSLFQFFIGKNGKVAPRKLRGYLGGTFSEHDLLHNHGESGINYIPNEKLKNVYMSETGFNPNPELKSLTTTKMF